MRAGDAPQGYAAGVLAGAFWTSACRVSRYRCGPCRIQCRPVLDVLGVEPGRISGSLARLLALLAVVAPYPLAARLAWLLLGVVVSPMGVWRVAQRLGQAAANYSEGLSAYHADSRAEDVANRNAPPMVVLSVDGCALGMQVHARRRRRKEQRTTAHAARRCRRAISAKSKPVFCCCRRNGSKPRRDAAPWCAAFWSVVWGTPMRSSIGCMRKMRELGWLDSHTMVVIVGDGAEWIWNRATWFVRRCEILDFWHAVEHAWVFARLRYGDGSAQADQWVHAIAEDLRAGKVHDVIARLNVYGRRAANCARASRDSFVTTARTPGACSMTSTSGWVMASAVGP